MNAVVLHGHSPACFSFNKQINLGKPICFLKDRSLAFALRKDVLQFCVSSTKSDGSADGRRLQKHSAPGRIKIENEGEKSESSGGKIAKSAEQERIMALFRRIRSSISNGEAKKTKQTKPKSTKKSPTESIRKVLRQSEKPVKDATKSRGDSQGVPKEDHKIKQPEAAAPSNFSLTRPPSNFVKKSPIPSPSVSRNNDPPGTTDGGKMSLLPRIEEMKLTELKELAKCRGIKGYSKLKKSQLLELLRQQKLKSEP